MAQGWKVTNVAQTTELTRGNRFEQVYEVEITMDDGTTFTISIPASEYDPATVQARASAEVAKHKAVLDL